MVSFIASFSPRDRNSIPCTNLISDHVLFSYVKICDFFSNIEFKFEFDCCHRFRHEPDQENIRGCGVFPVYPSELGLKLFGSSSKEIFELEIITQISDNESQSRAIGNGVGGSNTEN